MVGERGDDCFSITSPPYHVNCLISISRFPSPFQVGFMGMVAGIVGFFRCVYLAEGLDASAIGLLSSSGSSGGGGGGNGLVLSDGSALFFSSCPGDVSKGMQLFVSIRHVAE